MEVKDFFVTNLPSLRKPGWDEMDKKLEKES